MTEKIQIKKARGKRAKGTRSDNFTVRPLLNRLFKMSISL